jgi:uncharacterized membrane protein YhaH (DUF805 family)
MFTALFSAKGRMRRRDWWLWLIAYAIFLGVTEGLMHRFFGTAAFKDEIAFKGWPTDGFQYWLIVLIVVGQWPSFCLTAKRWHDRNRPGWLASLGIAIYLPQGILAHFGEMIVGPVPQFIVGATQAILGLAGIAYSLWVLVDCGILDGTQGPNRYGPSPKGVGAQPEDVF